MKRYWIVLSVAGAALVLFSAGFLAGAETRPALMARIPGAYARPARPSVLELELIRVAPTFLTMTDGTGAAYLDFRIEPAAGKVVIKFTSTGALWDRQGLANIVAMVVQARFPEIPKGVWVIEVIDLAAKQVFQWDGVRWTSRKWGGE